MTRKGMLKGAGSILLSAAMVLGTLQGFGMKGPVKVSGETLQKAEDHLVLQYDEPAVAGLYEIFASRKWKFTWTSDGVLLGDDNMEFGRSDKYNYTDGQSHSSSKDTTKPIQFGGTWDVTDAVKQGVSWAKHALPVGNGHMGAMSFGYTDTEIVQMNEETLWTGGPGCEDKLDAGNDGDVYGNKNIADPAANMKGLIDSAFEEYYASLESGNKPDNGKATPFSGQNTEGRGVTPNAREQEGAYQSFCEMKLDYNHPLEDTTDYRRELNLNTAVSTVSYKYGGVSYARELFASYPDDVMVYKISASEEGKLNFKLRPEIPQMDIFQGRYVDTSSGYGKEHYGKKGTVVAEGDTITLSGTLNHNDMKFAGKFKVITNGTLKADNEVNVLLKEGNTDHGSLTISNADEAYIIVSLTTDYVNDFDRNYSTGETLEQLEQNMEEKVERAAAKGYDALLSSHKADYKQLFDRVKLDIGAEIPQGKMTDDLLDEYQLNYKSNKTDQDYNKYLETLYYQYGRYLLIASSREGSLPANLQGIWNDTDGPAWNSDFHTNINLQMNYWMAESTNLAETATALVDYANSLRKPGRLSLAKNYGIGYEAEEANIDLETEDGFVFFCSTAPRGFTGNIDSTASFTQTATAFLGQNMYDYYAFTKDMEYLRSNIYPYLREACVTYLQTLEPGRSSEDQDQLFIAPSFSSEQGAWTVGTYFDQQLVWQLFHDTIKVMEDMGIKESDTMGDEGAKTYLNDDSKLLARLKDAIGRLEPVEIGADGQIKEWQQEVGYLRTSTNQMLGEKDDHRHISSLAAMYPGTYITKDNEPLIEAAKVVLTRRTDASTGWGLAHRLNLWARTGDGEHSYDLVNSLLATCTYDNLFDTHAPFQIDGNFGATAGITEMLLQSQNDKVELLPALPSAWAEGSYEGLVARGNFEVDLQWKDCEAKYAAITSNAGGTLVVDGMDPVVVTDAKGTAIDYKKNADGTLSLETEKGNTYIFAVKGYEPVIPTEPSSTEEPSESVEPTEPSDTEEPSESVEPTTPSDTEQPSESVPPTEPGNTDEPTESVEPTNPPESQEPGVYGDVNEDGKVDLSDVQMVLRAALHIIELDEKQIHAADYNADEKITLFDAQMLLRKVLMII
ncbi:MAG: hypothetical protein HFI75_04990 [Lachnospiraceae bacterium]|nr:hypothetical protein [Lachnospiraceae bacterium]